MKLFLIHPVWWDDFWPPPEFAYWPLAINGRIANQMQAFCVPNSAQSPEAGFGMRSFP